MQKIIFVCRHNKFRSKVAEAMFNKLNKNKNIKAESAGLFVDSAHLFIEPIVLGEIGRRGYNIVGSPRQLTRELAEKFDKIIIVADDIDKEFFFDFKGKVMQWNISDCDPSDVVCIEDTIDDIEKRVEDFVSSLE
ncbi:MAG: hypothetical protein AABW51_03325 [Nanoarchaeota archaeon]